MTKESKDISKSVNTPPGSLLHIGEKKVENVRITYTKYNSTEFERKEINTVNEFFKDVKNEDNKVKWLDIVGLHDTDIINEVGEGLGIHPLAIEDILNTTQNPKL